MKRTISRQARRWEADANAMSGLRRYAKSGWGGRRALQATSEARGIRSTNKAWAISAVRHPRMNNPDTAIKMRSSIESNLSPEAGEGGAENAGSQRGRGVADHQVSRRFPLVRLIASA